MRIAIAGGHGQIARALGRRLSADGHEVIGLIRNPDQSRDLEDDGMTPRVVSLEDAEVNEVADAVTGCDAVVFAAGGGPESGRAQVDGRPRGCRPARRGRRAGRRPSVRPGLLHRC